MPDSSVESLFDSRGFNIIRAVYRAGYLAGYENAAVGLDPRPDPSDDELIVILAALRMVTDA